ncbi:MFS transporter [Streptomyces sp. WMMB303]|uniref:MFS transporter n=1 Tax=Streptomyces sp. WMMB303 TaxID=3034154 RepID=UPI0023EE2083|nr:MFS transporter [Streptomyces sp. WMMB303]MDF4251735.1 MFS transporter [Streptomyces sp. WMMB303]
MNDAHESTERSPAPGAPAATQPAVVPPAGPPPDRPGAPAPAADGKPTGPGSAEQKSGLMRDHDFRMLFSAAVVSKVGTHIGYIALPLVAIETLDASAGQVGVLGMLSTVAFLLIGLPAGAWVDRMHYRRTMITADVVRAVLLGSVPLAALFDALTITQLYAVVLLNGCATVFFDVAAQSCLPGLVGRDRLVAANAQLNSWDAALQAGGRGGGGFLVQALTAPVAVLANALGFVSSALLLGRISKQEIPPERDRRKTLWAEVGEGVRFVAGHTVLRPVALAGSCTNLSVFTITTMVPVVFRDELDLPLWAVGLFLSIGGIGVFAGALTARRVGDRLGPGRAPWILGMCTVPFALTVPLVDRGWLLGAAAGAWLLVTFRMGVDNVLLVSFRQRVTPGPLLGRMNATIRFLFTGALAVGGGIAAVVGEYASPRAALWVGAVGLAGAWLPVFLSPLRTMRTLPDQ